MKLVHWQAITTVEHFAVRIITILQSAQYEAYITGGYCRDILLGKRSDDIDIAAGCDPHEIITLLSAGGISGSYVKTASAYPVVLAKQRDIQIHIAAFRKDIYEKNTSALSLKRTESGTLAEDARRRDLTINALYFNPHTREVLDPTNHGSADLAHKIIRLVGDASARIEEDGLRILRAVRFKNSLQFRYETHTRKALEQYASRVLNVSGQRCAEEITKMLRSAQRAQAVRDLVELGIAEYVAPQLSAVNGDRKLIRPATDVLSLLSPDVSEELGWAALLYSVQDSRSLYAVLGERLHFSKAITNRIMWLIRNWVYLFDYVAMSRKEQLELMFHPQFSDLNELFSAIVHAHHSSQGKKILQDFEKSVLELQNEKLDRIPTIKHDFQISGQTFITRYVLSSTRGTGDGKRLGDLLFYLDSLYQNALVRSREDLVYEADKWWNIKK